MNSDDLIVERMKKCRAKAKEICSSDPIYGQNYGNEIVVFNNDATLTAVALFNAGYGQDVSDKERYSPDGMVLCGNLSEFMSKEEFSKALMDEKCPEDAIKEDQLKRVKDRIGKELW